ncbi:MAG: GNAT family N-acetyltransferase [Gemmatales bacterium]
MSITITPLAADSVEAVSLINELEEHLGSFGYPPASRHGFSVEKLVREGVPFFVMHRDHVAVGCGGVKLFDTEYGEVKRMFIRPAYQRQGLGQAMLQHLADYARPHQVPLLRLETGIYQLAAIKLYERFGFKRCGPFGEYRDDPLSVYMEMGLGGG